MSELPIVSVIIPCRNEERFIGQCLASIMANDYPKERLDVLVVDGMSTDGTREILKRFTESYPFVKILDNPRRITPVAFNIGVKNSLGSLIMIMGAHSTYASDYIRNCVRYLEEYNADNVGGSLETRPRAPTLVGRGIVAGLSHRFGVGNSTYKVQAQEPAWVDTVFGGCYKREVFERIGLFNEDLRFSQDMEFNRRLRKAGGKILYAPSVVSYYYARSDIVSFCRHNFRNGIWSILPFAYSDVMPVALRHLVPFAFVTALVGSAVLGFVVLPFFWLCVVIVIAYSLGNLAASLQIAWRQRDWRLFLVMPLVFGLLHLVYGVGSVWGLTKLSKTPQFWKRVPRFLWKR